MKQGRTIWMCMTRRCNFACGYCYQGSHAKVPAHLEQYMSPETERLAMAWSHEWARDGASITWYGGEPLLAFNLIREIVPEWEEQRGLLGLTPARHQVTTNGSLLLPPVRAWMDEHKFGLLFSLDGPKRF